MEDLKIRVDNDAESREVQELFFELGYKWFSGGNQAQHLKQSCSSSFGYLVAWSSGCFTDVIQCGCGNEDAKEITLPELRDMVVLKRNSIDDANAFRHDNGVKYYITSGNKYYYFSNIPTFKWTESCNDIDYLEKHVKPIGKKEMKEYLRKNNDGEYILEVTNEREAQEPHAKHWIEVPEGATKLVSHDYVHLPIMFVKPCANGYSYCYPSGIWSDTILSDIKGRDILWSRHTHPEELPFIDDEPKRKRIIVTISKPLLNDQYAEIEKVRQSAWQKQEGGSHYKNLKIQPMQYALENKLDYAQANVVKYVTRHKEKNGKEDLLKAIHNIELMIEFYYGGGE